MKTMLSKFASTCTCCHKPIKKGEMIAYSRAQGARHLSCAGLPAPVSPQDVVADIRAARDDLDAGMIDANLADIIFQVAINGTVIFG